MVTKHKIVIIILSLIIIIVKSDHYRAGLAIIACVILLIGRGKWMQMHNNIILNFNNFGNYTGIMRRMHIITIHCGLKRIIDKN